MSYASCFMPTCNVYNSNMCVCKKKKIKLPMKSIIIKDLHFDANINLFALEMEMCDRM